MDTNTILMVAAMTLIANGSMLVLVRRRLPSSLQSSVVYWLGGTLLIAGGCFTFGLKEQLPRLIQLALPNGLIIFGLGFYCYSACRFCGRPSHHWFLALPFIGTVGICVFDVYFPDPWARVLIGSFVWMVLLIHSGLTLSRYNAKEPSRSVRVLTWMFYLVAAWTALRLVYLAQRDLFGLNVTDNSVINTITSLLAFTLPMLGSTVFALLCFERVRQQSVRHTETLGYVSHDLRAPLSTIIGNIGLLRRSATPDQAMHLQAIERSAGFQLSLIDEIMEYAKQELKPLHIQPSYVDFHEFLGDVAAQGRMLCRLGGNRFTIAAPTPLPATIKLDGRRLSQALLNLISNAAKFTKQGDVTLSILAELAGSDVYLLFCVSDSGPGVPYENQKDIFDAFKPDRPPQGGSGLGLHIAQNIIRNMGGVLKLQSEPGTGAHFSFRLRVPMLGNAIFDLDGVCGESEFGACHPELSRSDRNSLDLGALAQLAVTGEVTEIEKWLDDAYHKRPECHLFLDHIRDALERMDLKAIALLSGPEKRAYAKSRANP